MTIKETISHLKKSPLDGWYYVQGNIRLSLYGSKYFKWLLRKHIIEQFEYRRDVAANPCFKRRSCICCGCDTPALFFCDKPCSVGKDKFCQADGLKQCYGKMLSRKEWKQFKKYITT